MRQEIKKILFAIAALVLIDALIAFYLGALILGFLLLFAAACFVFGGIQTASK
jgi:asparagine N-glycosylation enzyme membrane subunit Stt3